MEDCADSGLHRRENEDVGQSQILQIQISRQHCVCVVTTVPTNHLAKEKAFKPVITT